MRAIYLLKSVIHDFNNNLARTIKVEIKLICGYQAGFNRDFNLSKELSMNFFLMIFKC